MLVFEFEFECAAAAKFDDRQAAYVPAIKVRE